MMPERRPRPIHALRHGDNDDPPATESLSPAFQGGPRWQRHRRIEPVLDTEYEEFIQQNDRSAASGTGRSRRRRRSVSGDEEHDEDGLFNTAHSPAGRRGYDELRQRLLKRRRFDLDTTPVSYPPIRYGYFGNVEPGRLKMIMISCDGGEHNDPKNPTMYLGPHNILRADKSVYCSARREASIVLRHADDTPFSLTQVTIIAPEHGFQAPVRYGSLHVGMSLSSVRAKSNGSIQLPPNHHSIADDARLSLREALLDPQISRRMSRNKALPHTLEDYGQYLEEPWRGEITLLDDCGGPQIEDASPADVLEYRLQRLHDAEARQYGVAGWRGPRDPRRNDDWISQLESYGWQPQIPTQESEPYGGATLGTMESETLSEARGTCDRQAEVVSAPWMLSPERDRVTIKFNTPASGRFILLKMASAEHLDSIAVQSVIVTGYGGPRFLPACSPR